MFEEAFIRLDAQECETVLGDINPALEGGDFDSGSVTILGQELSFYPGYRFLDMADYEVTPHFRKFVIYKPGAVIVLDWTNKPLYELNNKAPLELTKETIADYVRFFFTYVRGPHGKFSIIETVDDISWSEEPPPAARKSLGKMLQPVMINGKNGDNSFHLTACLMFKGTLYKASIFVTKDGRITVSDEEIIIDDMPVADDIFGQ